MENIAPALLDWFYKNHRILPFREDPTPYHVWLSEVMLQQTRVSAALPYYERFLAALPDIPALAACDEEKLHYDGTNAEIVEESSISSIIPNGTKVKLTLKQDKINVFTADGKTNLTKGVVNDVR